MKEQTIILGGGCFWCLDASYRQIDGITEVTSGYAGGTSSSPTYDEVASGASGHAEVVRVQFDTATISLDTVLDIFFTIHDPTTLNRQGADVGSQYRSCIYYDNPEQLEHIQAAIHAAEKTWGSGTTTEVRQGVSFYPAEEYHQDYFNNNPGAGYCQVVIRPKLEKLAAKFS